MAKTEDGFEPEQRKEILNAYRPGLIFKSPYTGFQFIVQGAEPTYSQTGVIISRSKEIVADFGVFGDEYEWENGGERGVSADIRGGYFDLDSQAEQKKWTSFERALVAWRLLAEESRQPDYTLYSKPPLTAPWAKYDVTAPDEIANIAEATGFVAEALAYEKENLNRKPVVTALEKILDAGKVAEEFAAA